MHKFKWVVWVGGVDKKQLISKVKSEFKAERETKKRFKKTNKYDINKNPNLKIRRHPMIAPLLFDFTNPKKFGGFT